MSHDLPAPLSLLARLAHRAHEAVFAPLGRSPDPTPGSAAPNAAPAPAAGDPDGAMDYRHATRDLARCLEELRAAADLVHAPRDGLDIRELLDLRLDPPQSRGDERAALERAQRRHQRDHGLTWQDGARQRPAAAMSPTEVRRVLTAIHTLTLRIADALDAHGATTADLDHAVHARVRAANQHLATAHGRLVRAAGVRPSQPKPPPRCANDPCPNPKRARGAECEACARHRQRHREPRPIEEARTP